MKQSNLLPRTYTFSLLSITFFVLLTVPCEQSGLFRRCSVNSLSQGRNHVRIIILDVMIGQRRGELREAENLHCFLRKLQPWNARKEIRSSSTLSRFNLFPSLVLTSVRSHFPERGRSVWADSGHSVGVLQVRHAGSQPLAQSVAGAGVASVARFGQIGHERTSRRLCHCTIPGERRIRAGSGG